jgi:hypothetical protein
MDLPTDVLYESLMFFLPHYYEDISYCIQPIHDVLSLLFEQHTRRIALPNILNQILGFATSSLIIYPERYPNVSFFICNAVSMYTNIDTQHALKTLGNFFYSSLLCDDTPKYALLKALQTLMTYNIFRFCDTF